MRILKLRQPLERSQEGLLEQVFDVVGRTLHALREVIRTEWGIPVHQQPENIFPALQYLTDKIGIRR